MIFQYGESWLAKDEPMALSRFLPLREEPRAHSPMQCII